ncbi:MAG: TonB-dependent receptor domain-containing protein [Candidatus Cyclobacteriaceae bacterium M2_1C_046]
MLKLQNLLFFVFLFLSVSAFAQKGTIRGTVIDDATGELLFSVTVVIKGTTTGAVTDFDGKFEIPAEPGTHDLQASYIGYQPITISGVEVKPGEVTLIDQIRLKETSQQLQEVVVKAEVLRTTEAALMTVKRKSANLIDGISAAKFRKIGDSDAAAAAKRITGVSIDGGKYVFVRGLGDRYTKTLLNGMDVPGLDPDRNSLQMDIFPTNVLDNIIVSKSFTADLPADFTGGIVNIETKAFPDERSLVGAVGLGYNPSMHFQDNFLTYEGGNTDFLAFDDGTRELPFSDEEITNNTTGGIIDPRTLDPNSPEGRDYKNQLRSFNNELGAMEGTSFMDYNLSFSAGDQTALGDNTLGYNLALSYKNTTDFFNNALYARYGLDERDRSNFELERRELQTGRLGINNVLLGGLAGLALKTDHAKYRFNLLHLQNGEKRAGIFDFIGSDEGADFLSFQHNLEYSERSLTNLFLGGEHFLGEGKWLVDWNLSPTWSSIDDPDIRFTRYEVRNEGDLSITSEGGFPERIWRNLDEVNLAGNVNLTREYNFNDNPAKVKFGGGNTYKERVYAIRRFQFFIDPSIELTGNPDEIIAPENTWPLDGNRFRGNYFIPDFIPVNPNYFNSSINNTAVYISNEFKPVTNLKAVIGVRAEDYTQKYTGTNQTGITLEDSTVIDEFNFFPSANLIYSLNENQNLRVSYSRTIARFSFKEASYAEIFDPLTGRTFLGALNKGYDQEGNVIWDGNIESTLINNFDLRWEMFQQRGQMISVSGFYKQFYNAIEMVQSATADNNFQPRNIGDATVMGIEIEFMQSLKFISPAIENLTFSGNVTIIDSDVEMSQEEYQSRLMAAREGQEVKETRQLQGQSPYIINGGFAYTGLNNGIEAGLYYNVQGPTLLFTGITDKPDIYSVPFHSLNFTANKSFGENERMRLSLKVNNILGDERDQVYQSFGAQDQFFQSLDPGRSVSISFNYSFL